MNCKEQKLWSTRIMKNKNDEKQEWLTTKIILKNKNMKKVLHSVRLQISQFELIWVTLCKSGHIRSN